MLGFHPSGVRFDLSEVAGGSRSKEYLTATTRLFLGNLLQQCGGNCSVVTDTDITVRIATTSPDLTLNWRTDESYSLEIVTRG